MALWAGKLATLSLEKPRQNGHLRVQQREVLRRALIAAAESLGWELIRGTEAERLAAAKKDVAKLANMGAELLERDLADLLATKKGETAQIKKVAQSLGKLAADSNTSYPAKAEYAYTARNGSAGLVTKTEILTLEGADEAQSASNTLENRLEDLTKLRDLMLEDIKRQQRLVSELKKDMSSILESAEGLTVEVLSMPR